MLSACGCQFPGHQCAQSLGFNDLHTRSELENVHYQLARIGVWDLQLVAAVVKKNPRLTRVRLLVDSPKLLSAARAELSGGGNQSSV
jgi:hypothetical protein